VTAIDASATAIARIREAAEKEHLAVEALEADLARFSIGRDYDSIVAIGLFDVLSTSSRARDAQGYPSARAARRARDRERAG